MAEHGETAAMTLQHTPLYERHRELGARLVEFGGWEMPVQYSSIIEEHRAVRQCAGLFDVCHMGEFRVTGTDALAFLQYLVPNDVGKLAINQALYTQLCLPSGGTIDDLLIYRLGENEYMAVVNASTMPKDWAWFSEHALQYQGIDLANVSYETGLIALQGPYAESILQPLTPATQLAAISYYHAEPGVVAGIACLISRTGYTGEDGFELYCRSEQVGALWDSVLTAGSPQGLLPAGLGARDTLRLEAGYCLYGHELTEDITPLEAGLGWTVKLNKDADFIGRQALLEEKQDGLRRKLIGLVLRERGVPRAGYVIMRTNEAAEPIGEVTSGTMCPTLDLPAALGFVPPDLSAPGVTLAVEIRGKPVAAEVVALPFYKRVK
ncbi:MAG: glycine cleavage system aminomethyltransferase GcvT [Ktedonobacterales bacterium]